MAVSETGAHDFLGMLNPEEFRALHERGMTRSFRRGAVILREAEEPTRVLVLTIGRAKAAHRISGRCSSSTREAVTKSLRTPRDLGWIETGRRSISVRDREALRRFSR